MRVYTSADKLIRWVTSLFKVTFTQVKSQVAVLKKNSFNKPVNHARIYRWGSGRGPDTPSPRKNEKVLNLHRKIITNMSRNPPPTFSGKNNILRIPPWTIFWIRAYDLVPAHSYLLRIGAAKSSSQYRFLFFIM